MHGLGKKKITSIRAKQERKFNDLGLGRITVIAPSLTKYTVAKKRYTFTLLSQGSVDHMISYHITSYHIISYHIIHIINLDFSVALAHTRFRVSSFLPSYPSYPCYQYIIDALNELLLQNVKPFKKILFPARLKLLVRSRVHASLPSVQQHMGLPFWLAQTQRKEKSQQKN